MMACAFVRHIVLFILLVLYYCLLGRGKNRSANLYGTLCYLSYLYCTTVRLAAEKIAALIVRCRGDAFLQSLVVTNNARLHTLLQQNMPDVIVPRFFYSGEF